ncbi:hypothetical protein [Pelagibius sp. Alg239-R121]|uniref:hypothetical protein n=1 Tax=Pelagibius sp. Alg239-R121 TaxID=2993448 RepID=UPI0024A7A150|nr:hypothetical protein [Pelagibius sp. Alg239-R121]
MGRVLAILTLCMLPLPVMADNAKPPGSNDLQMNGQYGPVPNPVPVGYPYCITRIATPEYREKYGLAAAYLPPQSREAAGALNFARREGIAVLVHCNEEQS